MKKTNAKRMAAFLRKLRDPLARHVKSAYVLGVVDELRERMPVVTGEARANIHVTAGGPTPASEEIKSPPFRVPSDDEVLAEMAESTADAPDHVDLLGHAALLGHGRRQGRRGILGSLKYPGPLFTDSLEAAKARLKEES